MLSVIVCTWNRCDSLRETLRSFERMNMPPGLAWELIVVDNNSTDATAQTVDEFRDRLPVERVFEPTAGKSHALNTAVTIARGELFIFTDDDVRVDSNWLAAYHDAFERYPAERLFGGPIEPLFEGDETPEWLKRGFRVVENAYAVIDEADAIGPITRESYPYGANMAVRRQVFDNHRYPTEVGPRPGSEVRGEEMMLIWAVLEAGGSGVWVQKAKVQHSIPPARQSLSYLRRYYEASGELMDLIDKHDVARLFGRPRWVWRLVVGEHLRYFAGRFTTPSTVWLRHYRQACMARGLLRGFKKGSLP